MRYRSITYLSVVGFAGAEQRVQRVVARNDESCKVHEEFASNVEEDEEEVDPGKAEEGIDLWYRGLLLEIVQSRVFRQLSRCQRSALPIVSAFRESSSRNRARS